MSEQFEFFMREHGGLFETIYNQYESYVPSHLREDLRQAGHEGLLRGIRDGKSFEDCFAAARTAMWTFARAEARHAGRTDPMDVLGDDEPSSPEDAAHQAVCAMTLEALLDSLPDSIRPVAWLRYHDCLTYEEIMRRLGLSMWAVRYMSSIARDMMHRKCMSEGLVESQDNESED